MAQQDGFSGQQQPSSGASQFNAINFIVRQILRLVSTATLVQVVSVTNDGSLAPVGYVDVQPLVNLVDGDGNSSEHGTIHNVPYQRVQGGLNAVIIDPEIGDIGVAVFADRDISSVKVNKGIANPGSQRRFDMADALYFGGFLNAVPVQYVQFTATGINIVDKNGNIIAMQPNKIEMTTLLLQVSGAITAGLEITAKAGTASSVTVTGHEHTQGSDSHGDTEVQTNPPVPGT